MNILNVVGARPNFMKIAPIMEAMHAEPAIEPCLLHTGQHYDANMNQIFFDQLGIPRPDIELGVGSGNQAWQVSEILKQFDAVLEERQPDTVLVVGDVNSTVACALAASYRQIPVVHVEAGLRSFDRTMPEEINRMATDRLTSLFFTTEPGAGENLLREGVKPEAIHFVGNVMVDTLLKHRPLAESTSRVLEELEIAPGAYAAATLHRPANVDDPDIIKTLLTVLADLSERMPVVFAMHPRTAKQIEKFQLKSLVEKLKCVPPLAYLDMVRLMSHAKMMLTDSGGVQEETTALGIPCLTLRDNTERPVTVTTGTNTLVGRDPNQIWKAIEDIVSTGGKTGRQPEHWDGHAAERIVKVLAKGY